MGWGGVHGGKGRCTLWDGEVYTEGWGGYTVGSGVYTVGWRGVHMTMARCAQWDGEKCKVGWRHVYSGIEDK